MPVEPNWRVIILPLLLVQMAALGLGIGCIVSALTTRYRDLAFMIQLRHAALDVCELRRLSALADSRRSGGCSSSSIRWCRSSNRSASPSSAAASWKSGTSRVSAAITAVLLFIGLVMFSRAEKTFMDTV